MICKNCEEQMISKGKYCHSCGQKSNTHRLTLKHFIMHDIVHGLFHLDKGLPFTIKEILIRPGKVALEYIAGKRKKYYNFFYLLLLIIGFYLFLKSFEASEEVVKGMADELTRDSRKGSIDLTGFIRDQKKIVIFSWIPILALSGFLVFRKLKFKLLEFFIPATIAVIGSSLANILLVIIQQFEFPANFFQNFVLWVLAFLILFFPMLTFIQFTRAYYIGWGRTWRIVAFYFLALLILIIVFVVTLFIANGFDLNIQAH